MDKSNLKFVCFCPKLIISIWPENILKIDFLMACTAYLVYLVSTVSGHCKNTLKSKR